MRAFSYAAAAAAADPVCPVSPYPTTSPAEFLRIREAEERAMGHRGQEAFYRQAAEDAERAEFFDLAKGLLAQVGISLFQRPSRGRAAR